MLPVAFLRWQSHLFRQGNNRNPTGGIASNRTGVIAALDKTAQYGFVNSLVQTPEKDCLWKQEVGAGGLMGADDRRGLPAGTEGTGRSGKTEKYSSTRRDGNLTLTRK